MTLDGVTISYAFFVGMFSFFSPCSVGLLPAYVGYYLSNLGPAAPERPKGNVRLASAQHPPLPRSAWAGTKLGLGGAAGFLALFLLVAAVYWFLPITRIGKALPYVAILVGALLIALGVLSLAGRGWGVRLPQVSRTHPLASVFAFGFAYCLASIGCNFPLFASVAVGPLYTGDAAAGAMLILTYAAGMALVFVLATIALSVSRAGVSRFITRATPIIAGVAAVVMILGGTYIIYYWARILEG